MLPSTCRSLVTLGASHVTDTSLPVSTKVRLRRLSTVSPSLLLPICAPSSPQLMAQTRLDGDESLTNFFRRLSFSPDDGLLLTPSGHGWGLLLNNEPQRGRRRSPDDLHHSNPMFCCEYTSILAQTLSCTYSKCCLPLGLALWLWLLAAVFFLVLWVSKLLLSAAVACKAAGLSTSRVLILFYELWAVFSGLAAVFVLIFFCVLPLTSCGGGVQPRTNQGT